MNRAAFVCMAVSFLKLDPQIHCAHNTLIVEESGLLFSADRHTTVIHPQILLYNFKHILVT